MKKFFLILFLFSFLEVRAQPIIVNTSAAIPTWVPAQHNCDNGTSTIPASPVSSNITPDLGGANAFQKTVNKALACCLNSSNSDRKYIGSAEKFDCKERSYVNLTFDQIWAQTNDGSQTGVPNAVALINAAGERLTGFFTSDLQRCNNYSDITNDNIFPGRVAAAMTTGIQQSGPVDGAFQTTGTAIPHPTGTGWYAMVTGPWATGREVTHAPNCTENPAECRRCNILIRAVALAKCPDNVVGGPVLTLTSTSDNVKHCSVADEVQIRIHAQQIFEIGGRRPMKEFDTETDSSSVSRISVKDLYR